MRQPTRNALTITLSLGSLIVVAALLAALSGGPRIIDPYSGRPSTMFTNQTGARAALLVARELLPSAEQWRAPMTTLPAPSGASEASTLVVAGPVRPLQSGEADALDRWVRAGGQLILTIADDWRTDERSPSAPPTAVQIGYLERHGIEVRGDSPVGTADRGPVYEQVRFERISAERLTLRLRPGRSVVGNARPLAMVGDDVVIAQVSLGRGRIIIIPDAAFLSNGSLVRSDNAAVLVGLCAGWGGGRVLFDEFHHGFGKKRGMLALGGAFAATPWGWAALTVVAAGAACLLARGRRFGRPVDPPPPDRASPLDLVDARAGLFRTAGSCAWAVQIIVGNLTHELGRALGRPVDLAELYRHHQHSADPPVCLDQIGALAQLFLRVRAAGQAEQRDVFTAGRLAGRILQEMSVD